MAGLLLFSRRSCRSAMAGYWLARVLAAWLVAAPFTSALGSALKQVPRGSNALLEPGGAVLLEVIRLTGPALAAALESSLLLLLAAGMLLLGPLQALMMALSRSAAELADDTGSLPSETRDAEHSQPPFSIYARFLLLGAIGLVAQVLLVLTALLITSALGSLYSGRINESANDIVTWLVLGILLLPAAFVQPVLDLARTRTCQRTGSLWATLGSACEVLVKRRRQALTAYAALAGLSLLTLALALIATSPLREASGTVTSPQLTLVTLSVHQLAFLAATVCRAAWLSLAAQLCSAFSHGRRELDGTGR